MALTNDQYNSLIRQYEEKTRRHEAFIAAREKQLYDAIPQLAQLDQDLVDSAMDAFYARIKGDKSTTLSSVSDKRKKLIAAAGFPADFTTPVYDCPDCKDTGFIDGKKCHCFTQAAMDICFSQSGIQQAMADNTFDSFDFSLFKDSESLSEARDAYNTARAFCDDFSESHDNLVIWGATGTGKTFLSGCIGNALLKEGYSVLYFTAFGLFDVFERRVFKHDETIEDVHDMVFDCDLLIIDDLGTEMNNSFISSRLYQCLNERLMRGRSTVISTNLSLKDLRDRYTERVSSRVIADYKPIRLSGKDLRVESITNPN